MANGRRRGSFRRLADNLTAANIHPKVRKPGKSQPVAARFARALEARLARGQRKHRDSAPLQCPSWRGMLQSKSDVRRLRKVCAGGLGQFRQTNFAGKSKAADPIPRRDFW